MFEWDEEKRASNLTKHGVDFETAALIFEGKTLEAPDVRRDYGEPRIGAFGESDGDVLFVIHTWRGSTRRLISARKASSHERKTYLAALKAGGKIRRAED